MRLVFLIFTFGISLLLKSILESIEIQKVKAIGLASSAFFNNFAKIIESCLREIYNDFFVHSLLHSSSVLLKVKNMLQCAFPIRTKFTRLQYLL